MTIKEATIKVRNVEHRFGNQCTVSEDLLGVHEALTKLWLSQSCQQGKSETEKRISNLLYGTLLVANKLGVDIEKSFDKRIAELEKQ